MAVHKRLLTALQKFEPLAASKIAAWR